jgi:serine/threonine protein kinase
MTSFKLKLPRCLVQPKPSISRLDIDLLEELNVPFDQLYSMSNILGRGAVATVYLGVELATARAVAIKVVCTTRMSVRQVEDLKREVRILSKVTHANVVHLIRAYKNNTHCYLVQELVSGGELFEHIINRGHIPEREARSIIQHLTSAVAYLHCKGIAHRDIKPENVLMGGGRGRRFWSGTEL